MDQVRAGPRIVAIARSRASASALSGPGCPSRCCRGKSSPPWWQGRRPGPADHSSPGAHGALIGLGRGSPSGPALSPLTHFPLSTIRCLLVPGVSLQARNNYLLAGAGNCLANHRGSGPSRYLPQRATRVFRSPIPCRTVLNRETGKNRSCLSRGLQAPAGTVGKLLHRLPGGPTGAAPSRIPAVPALSRNLAAADRLERAHGLAPGRRSARRDRVGSGPISSGMPW